MSPILCYYHSEKIDNYELYVNALSLVCSVVDTISCEMWNSQPREVVIKNDKGYTTTWGCGVAAIKLYIALHADIDVDGKTVCLSDRQRDECLSFNWLILVVGQFNWLRLGIVRRASWLCVCCSLYWPGRRNWQFALHYEWDLWISVCVWWENMRWFSRLWQFYPRFV